ncbi:MAG: diphthine synthase [Methanomicrobiales archaeon]|jgi:diphthine synthase|nr:diphthine synthase [Methanomicrobiales archaeon]
MLFFVGLGLYGADDVSVRGMSLIRDANYIYLEGYTSLLMGASPDMLSKRYQKPIHVLGREDVEIHPDTLIKQAKTHNVVFLTGGDPMVSTTHADLRIRAAQEGVQTEIIHGASISSAVCGLSGLQNYRFGKSCSIPFPYRNWMPRTPVDTIEQNRTHDLHTLVYLDIQPKRYMQIHEAIDILITLYETADPPLCMPELYIGIARAGSDEPEVYAGNLAQILSHDFGSPLHILIVPASLHHIEQEYLMTFAHLLP